VARVLAFIPDLLFGSRVQAGLAAAGHEVELVADGAAVRERLTSTDVLVVDLTDEQLLGVGLVKSLTAEGALTGIRTLGFYSHVEVEARRQAEDVGFDLVVPRSRMAREGAELVTRLVSASRQ
jgi:DNA-binding response OmpR family regulator